MLKVKEMVARSTEANAQGLRHECRASRTFQQQPALSVGESADQINSVEYMDIVDSLMNLSLFISCIAFGK